MTAPAINELVDAMVGKPFVWGARGPDSYYCLGIFLDLLERTRGIRLPGPFGVEDEEKLRRFFERFLALPKGFDVQPLDLFFWRWGSDAHVAIVESDRWTVSVSPEAGVHRARVDDARARAETLYRLKELVA